MMVCLDAQQNAVQQQEIGSWSGWQQEAEAPGKESSVGLWAAIAALLLFIVLGSGSGGDK